MKEREKANKEYKEEFEELDRAQKGLRSDWLGRKGGKYRLSNITVYKKKNTL